MLVDSLKKALAAHRDTLRLLRDVRVASAYHCSGGSSWKTLRVPSSHCCVSASK